MTFDLWLTSCECRPANIRWVHCLVGYSAGYSILRLFRTSSKAALFPSTTPGQKSFYIPANRTQVSYSLKIQYTFNILISRCIYSVFVMHRRTDLWGPDGAFLPSVVMLSPIKPIQHPRSTLTGSSMKDWANT
jgi:hypothetical protein